jgi:hypothetical protein
LKGKLRKRSIDLLASTNDRWVNGHNKAALLTWGGNIDIALLLDFESQLNYIAKYTTKIESNSDGFSIILRKTIQKGREYDWQGRSVLRSLFIQLNAGREKSQQETAHLSLSLPMVKCTHRYLMKLTGLCYVMFSRITSTDNLYIPTGVTFERVTTKISQQRGLQARKAEEIRLQQLHLETCQWIASNT